MLDSFISCPAAQPGKLHLFGMALLLTGSMVGADQAGAAPSQRSADSATCPVIAAVPVSASAADWAERARIIAMPKGKERSRAMMAWQTDMSQRARQKLIAPLDDDRNGAVDAGYEDEFHCRMVGERLRRGQECVAWFAARFDRNLSGAIDVDEWPAVAAACPILTSKSDTVEELLWACPLADSNNNGWIDEGESLFVFRVDDMVQAITHDPKYFLPYQLKELEPRPIRSIPYFPFITEESAGSAPGGTCTTSDADLARGYALARAVMHNGRICLASRQKRPFIPTYTSPNPDINEQVISFYTEWIVADALDTTSLLKHAPILIYIPSESIERPQRGYCWGSLREDEKVVFTFDDEAVGQEALVILDPLEVNQGYFDTEPKTAAIRAASGTRAAFAINRGETLSGVVAVASPLWVALERTSSTAARQALLRAGYAQELIRRKEHRGRWVSVSDKTVFTYEDFVVEVLSQGATPSFRELIAEAIAVTVAYRAGTRLPLVRTGTGIAMRHYLLMQIAGQEMPSFTSVLNAVKKKINVEAHPLPQDPSAYAVTQALADPASVMLVGRVLPTREHVVEYRGRARTVAKWMADPDLTLGERSKLVFEANTTIRLQIEEILKPGQSSSRASPTTGAVMPSLNVGGVVGVAMGIEFGEAPMPGQSLFNWMEVGMGARIIVLAQPQAPVVAKNATAAAAAAAMKLKLPLLAVFGYNYHAIIDCQLAPDLQPFTVENFIATARTRREGRFVDHECDLQPLPDLFFTATSERTLQDLGGITGLARPQWQDTLSDLRELVAGAKPNAPMRTSLGKNIQAFCKPKN